MQRSDYQNSEKTAIKHIDMEEEPPDYFQSEYTTHILSPMSKRSPHQVSQDYNQSPSYPRKDRTYQTYMGSTVSRVPSLQTDCEVDTGAGCNIIPAPQGSTTVWPGITRPAR